VLPIRGVRSEVRVCVVPEAGVAWTDALEAEIVAHLRSRRVRAIEAGQIVFVNELPKTRSGKLLWGPLNAAVASSSQPLTSSELSTGTTPATNA